FQPHILASWALITPPVLWLGEIGMQFVVAHRAPAAPARTAVIIGVTDLGLRLESQLQHDRSLNVQVAGFFEERAPERLPAHAIPRILGKPSDLPEFVKTHGVKVVYVTLPMSRHPRIVGLL